MVRWRSRPEGTVWLKTIIKNQYRVFFQAQDLYFVFFFKTESRSYMFAAKPNETRLELQSSKNLQKNVFIAAGLMSTKTLVIIKLLGLDNLSFGLGYSFLGNGVAAMIGVPIIGKLYFLNTLTSFNSLNNFFPTSF